MNVEILDETISDAELENVAGGTGVQCIGILSRLKNLGVEIKTPLVAGNEENAVSELYGLAGFKGTGGGGDCNYQFVAGTNNKFNFSGCEFYHDKRPNVYKLDGKVISEDEFVKNLAKKLGK